MGPSHWAWQASPVSAQICPPPALPGGGVQQSRQGMGWGPQALLCLRSPLLMMAGIMLGVGGGGRQGTREAGVTVPVPTPGPLQLQTSASPRSYIHTSSAWASVCPCAEVSCSLGRAAGPVGVGRCFWGLLCPPLGQGAGPNASGLAVLAVEGPSWDRQPGDKGSRSSIRPSYIVWQQRWQWLLEEQLLLGEHSVLHDRLRLVQTYSSQGGIMYGPFSGGHC